MDTHIIQVGKTKSSFLHEGIEEFLKRLKPYTKLHIHETKEGKNIDNAAKQITFESEFVLKKLNKLSFNCTKIGLAIEGKSISSRQLAHYIEDQRDNSKSLCFIIGGAHGLSDEVKRKCDVLLSFSALTFTHEMIRMLLLEQIYRAFTIIENKPYHN